MTLGRYNIGFSLFCHTNEVKWSNSHRKSTRGHSLMNIDTAVIILCQPTHNIIIFNGSQYCIEKSRFFSIESCPGVIILWESLYFLKRSITKICLFKYIENFTIEQGKFSDKKNLIFSYFSKHRLWVLVRTASARRFWWVPTIYVFSNIRNTIYTPINPSFTI